MTQEQQPPSNPNQEKCRKPDYDVHQVSKENGKTQWMKIGALWEGKDGYISGDTVHGRFVLQPREAKEALQDMRNQNQGQSQDPAPKINP